MNKFSYILANVFTLGLYSVSAKNKAKKIASTPNSELQVAKKLTIDPVNFMKALGGKTNIYSCNAELSALKVSLVDGSTIKKENLDKFKIHGFMKNNNSLTLIIGDEAPLLAEAITKLL
jgi:phosphotransferase system IIB component